MRILICDDEQKLIDLELSILQEYCRSTNIAATFFTFTDSLSAGNIGEFDIAFLDIDMEKLNGIELARKLRSKNPTSIIIFVTNFIQYAPEGYEVNWVLEQIEIGGARCRTHAVINQRGLEMKKESCPKLAKRCDCGAKTIEKAFRSETVDIKTAEQVAIALGCKVDDAFDVETIAKPMTRKSMREYALFIRSTLEYADENYGVKNPMHKIPALGSQSRSVDTIKKHQIKQLQDTLKESSMLEQVIVLSLLNSGVRRGELAGLTWKDVNFEECTIHISKSLLVFKDFGYQLTTTKESNIRDVDVAPEYMDFLKEYYKYWKSQKKLMGGSWQKSLDKKSSKYAPSLLALRGTDFVICNDHGFPINPDSYGALVRRIGQRAGIEGLHPHMFRHTFVSILLSNPEIGVATVAAEAGHAQPSTTLAIYTQVYDKRRKEIRNQMSKELYE